MLEDADKLSGILKITSQPSLLCPKAPELLEVFARWGPGGVAQAWEVRNPAPLLQQVAFPPRPPQPSLSLEHGGRPAAQETE